jgi:hypothetical protein
VRQSEASFINGDGLCGPDKNFNCACVRQTLHVYDGSPGGRSNVIPHLKSYCKVIPDGGGARRREIAWAIMGSSNLSSSAWGELQIDGSRVQMRHYEMCVLLTPEVSAAAAAAARASASASLSSSAASDLMSTATPTPVHFYAMNDVDPPRPVAVNGDIYIPIPYVTAPVRFSDRLCYSAGSTSVATADEEHTPFRRTFKGDVEDFFNARKLMRDNAAGDES